MIEYLRSHQADEWIKKEAYYLNKFFSKLRLYAREDLNNAVFIFNKFFPTKFIPKKSLYISGYYRMFFKFFGFKKTERLHKLFRP